MIQSLKEFHIPGIDYTFSINTTHVAMLLVSVFIIIMAIVARVKINKVKPDDTPGMFQNAIEIIVEMLGTMVDGIMGKNANKFVNYISTLFLFIIISNIRTFWSKATYSRLWCDVMPWSYNIYTCSVQRHKEE
jgi:F-type H+-transporting ATPase subunit a